MYQKKGIKYSNFIDGKKIDYDVPPILFQQRTLVPFRKIAEALGAQVNWSAQDRKVIVIKGDITIEIVVDNKTAKVNNTEITLDVPAKVYQNRTLVPLRFLAEALNTRVNYYPEGALIVIQKNHKKV